MDPVSDITENFPECNNGIVVMHSSIGEMSF